MYSSYDGAWKQAPFLQMYGRDIPERGFAHGKKKGTEFLSKEEKVECRDYPGNHELDLLDICVYACGCRDDVLCGYADKCHRFFYGAESV